ncbi:MAG: hypothetical protein EBQ87_06370 [Planctomycetes bacterium]|nr:hypothetical protein [Planctomycetota bacterium]
MAGVDTDQTERQTASAVSKVLQKLGIHLEKTHETIVDANNNGKVDAGDTVVYDYLVTNTGNVTLSHLYIVDDNGTLADKSDDFTIYFSTYFNNPSYSLAVTTSVMVKSNPIVLTEANISNGSVTNIAIVNGIGSGEVSDADDDVVVFPRGLIAPTGTTCDQYINGTSMSFSDYYAAQGGVIQYGVNNQGKINQANPGVFFYYTGLSGAINGGAAVDGKVKVYIDQSDNSSLFPAFGVTKNQVKLFKVNDVNGNGKIDAGDSCSQVQLNNSQITLGTNGDLGDVTIEFTPDAIGSLYVVSVQYTTSSVLGTNVGKIAKSWPSVNYTFTTDVGKDGSIEETASGGITIAPKKSLLKVNGALGHGASILSQAELTQVNDQAVQFWSQHGASAMDVAKLKMATISITNLGGSLLGNTDGQNISIDDDAGGFGWWLGNENVASNKMDLFSAVVHEYGHVLGLDHDVLNANLKPGERDLPKIDLSAKFENRGPASSKIGNVVVEIPSLPTQSMANLSKANASRIMVPNGNSKSPIESFIPWVMTSLAGDFTNSNPVQREERPMGRTTMNNNKMDSNSAFGKLTSSDRLAQGNMVLSTKGFDQLFESLAMPAKPPILNAFDFPKSICGK